MSRDLIIGVDAGTSVIKAVLFDADGRQLTVASRPNKYETLPGGGVEQDLDRTWTETAACLRELAAGTPDLGRRLRAIGVTGQGDGTWLIDAEGRPVGGGWLWLDSRAAGIVEEFDRSGARILVYRSTGCGMNACNQSAQLVWLKRHTPELLERASTAFHCKDWLYFNLTGERATDEAEGTFTFGDYRSRTYAGSVLEAIGIPELGRLLPPMRNGSRETRPLSEAAAEATGLPAGTPVALGFLDVVCTALGGGLYAPGRQVGASIVGSTGMHMRLFDSADRIELAAMPTGYTMPFPVPGTLAQMQSNMAATLNIDWIVGLACQASAALGHEVERRTALLALDSKVLDAKPGAGIYHPYISSAGERGPFVDVNARAQLSGLDQSVGFVDVVRAVYEGLGLAARDCYAAIGHRPEEIRVAGGAARSRSLKKILASAVGSPVRESSREEAGAAGVAMMAAVGTGLFPDMAEACARWVDPLLGATVEPDPKLVGLYDRLYPIYREMHEQMHGSWASLTAARENA
ncbi:MAG: FGGY-family carbohydrate kinase [Geminicoccaceae bacterium]